jgi:hypothetical protein
MLNGEWFQSAISNQQSAISNSSYSSSATAADNVPAAFFIK